MRSEDVRLAKAEMLSWISGELATKLTKTEASTILSPSATSPRSRAAFTLVRDREVINRFSNCSIASSHGSPTFVSRMVAARDGAIVMSDSKLDSGRSILYARM